MNAPKLHTHSFKSSKYGFERLGVNEEHFIWLDLSRPLEPQRASIRVSAHQYGSRHHRRYTTKTACLAAAMCIRRIK